MITPDLAAAGHSAVPARAAPKAAPASERPFAEFVGDASAGGVDSKTFEDGRSGPEELSPVGEAAPPVQAASVWPEGVLAAAAPPPPAGGGAPAGDRAAHGHAGEAPPDGAGLSRVEGASAAAEALSLEDASAHPSAPAEAAGAGVPAAEVPAVAEPGAAPVKEGATAAPASEPVAAQPTVAGAEAGSADPKTTAAQASAVPAAAEAPRPSSQKAQGAVSAEVTPASPATPTFGPTTSAAPARPGARPASDAAASPAPAEESEVAPRRRAVDAAQTPVVPTAVASPPAGAVPPVALGVTPALAPSEALAEAAAEASPLDGPPADAADATASPVSAAVPATSPGGEKVDPASIALGARLDRLQPDAGAAWRLSALADNPHAEKAAAAPAARDLSGQITLAVTQATQPQVEIRLDPPELGRVQIRLNPIEGGGLQAVVLADRPETQDFLRRNAETLVRDLTEAGYGEVSLEFAAGGEGPAPDARREERRFAPAFETAPVFASAPEAPRRAASGGLDIRL